MRVALFCLFATGDAGDSSTVSAGPTATAQITSVNAPAIADTVLEAIFINDDITDQGEAVVGASSATDVLLELDLDGDGAPEDIISTTWAEITA